MMKSILEENENVLISGQEAGLVRYVFPGHTGRITGECFRGKVIELEVQACEGMLGTVKNNQSRSIAVTKCRAVRAHAWQQHDQQRERSSGRVEKTVRPGDTNQLMGFAPRL
jgi:hypothetical protein